MVGGAPAAGLHLTLHYDIPTYSVINLNRRSSFITALSAGAVLCSNAKLCLQPASHSATAAYNHHPHRLHHLHSLAMPASATAIKLEMEYHRYIASTDNRIFMSSDCTDNRICISAPGTDNSNHRSYRGPLACEDGMRR